jgi:hypothetical protein
MPVAPADSAAHLLARLSVFQMDTLSGALAIRAAKDELPA